MTGIQQIDSFRYLTGKVIHKALILGSIENDSLFIFKSIG